MDPSYWSSHIRFVMILASMDSTIEVSNTIVETSVKVSVKGLCKDNFEECFMVEIVSFIASCSEMHHIYCEVLDIEIICGLLYYICNGFDI